MGETGDKKGKFTFAQGMQVFLVRKILTERYTMGLLVDTQAGNDFFHRWSQIVREEKGPRTLANPQKEAERLSGTTTFFGRSAVLPSASALISHGQTPDDREEGLSSTSTSTPTSSESVSSHAPSISTSSETVSRHPYYDLLTDARYTQLRAILADPILGELMRIEYPTDTRALAATRKDELPTGLLREAIARRLRIEPDELDEQRYRDIESLNLSGLEISDIGPLASLTNLQRLDLTRTQVSDLSPLANLTTLASLDLDHTPVSDVRPLGKLTNLERLDLDGTQVSELLPLAKLTGLQSLMLRGTRVSDVSPLARLVNLERLDLDRTQVSDLSPLTKLTKLVILDLEEAPVSDVSPLAKLSKLRGLNLRGTQVSDVSMLERPGLDIYR